MQLCALHSRDGVAAGLGHVDVQHTWADAMVAVTIFGKVMDNINAEVKKSGFPATHPAGHVSSRPAPRKLQWKLDDAVIEAVELACSNASKLIRVRACGRHG